jgi:predicted  nucleic acid-binding Zn-ribbon protein
MSDAERIARLKTRNHQLLEALREKDKELKAANERASEAEVAFRRGVNKIARLSLRAIRLRRQRERLRKQLNTQN